MRTQVFADFSKVKYDKDTGLRCPECRKHFSSLVVVEVVTKKGGRVNKLRCPACAGVSAVNTVNIPHEDTPAPKPKPRARPKASGSKSNTKSKMCAQCGATQDLFMSLATGSLLCSSCTRPDERANCIPYYPLGQQPERRPVKPWVAWVYGGQRDPMLDRSHRPSGSQPHPVDRSAPAMGGLEVDLGKSEVTLDHLQGEVTQEELETIDIALIAQVEDGERMPEPVCVDASYTCALPQALQV